MGLAFKNLFFRDIKNNEILPSYPDDCFVPIRQRALLTPMVSDRRKLKRTYQIGPVNKRGQRIRTQLKYPGQLGFQIVVSYFICVIVIV